AFSLKNVLAFTAIILSFYLKLAPWTSLLALLAIPFVYKQDRMLMKEQVKSKTFKCAVKILAFGSFIQVLTYSIGLLFLYEVLNHERSFSFRCWLCGLKSS